MKIYLISYYLSKKHLKLFYFDGINKNGLLTPQKAELRTTGQGFLYYDYCVIFIGIFSDYLFTLFVCCLFYYQKNDF